MILDQSVFFGVANVHDRHRDMRLDVDNMSYEVVSIFLTSTILSVFENCSHSRINLWVIGVVGSGRAHW